MRPAASLMNVPGPNTTFTVFARASDGISAYVVDAADVEIVERIDVIAPHPLARIEFYDAPAQLIGQRGEGMKIALATLDVFRSTVGAAALGQVEAWAAARKAGYEAQFDRLEAYLLAQGDDA